MYIYIYIFIYTHTHNYINIPMSDSLEGAPCKSPNEWIYSTLHNLSSATRDSILESESTISTVTIIPESRKFRKWHSILYGTALLKEIYDDCGKLCLSYVTAWPTQVKILWRYRIIRPHCFRMHFSSLLLERMCPIHVVPVKNVSPHCLQLQSYPT